MARKISLTVSTTTPYCSFTDYDNVTNLPYAARQCGFGEFSVEFVGSIVSPTALQFIHNPTGTVYGQFTFAEIETCAIDGVATGATTLAEVRDALAPYFFGNSASGFTHSSVIEITPTELTTLFSTTGIALLPTIAAGRYYQWEADMVHRGDGTEVYAGGAPFEFRTAGPHIMARASETLLTTDPATEIVVPQVRPAQLQGANARFQATEMNAALSLHTLGDVDFTISDVANGSSVYVLIRYNIIKMR